METTLPIIRALAALAATLGLLLTLAWAYRRYGKQLGLPQNQNNSRIHAVESKRLDAHTTLHLVRVDGTEHLIATTAAQTTVISTHPAAKAGKVKA